MFESDGKKQLKNKYNKMTKSSQDPNTVYGELKLSEKLSNELKKVSDVVN